MQPVASRGADFVQTADARGVVRLLAIAAALLAAAPAAAAPPRETAVGVSAREFSVSLYRAKVRPGTVKLNITNFGEDGHNLVVTRGPRVFGATPEIRAGDRGVLRVKLSRRGTYTLVCTIADHEQLGMRAKLRVAG
jgi:plastocyanin